MKNMIRPMIIILCSFILYSCELEETRRDEGEQINVGIMVPLSSDAKDFADAMRKACELAALEINRNGGVFGKSVKLKIVDTEGVPDVSVSGARALLEQNIVSVIGPVFSGNTIEVARQVLIPSGIPLVSPASTSPLITTMEEETGTDLVFRTVVSDAITGNFAGKYVYEKLAKTTVSIMYVNDAYGAGLSAAFAESFEKAGGTVINRIPYLFTSVDDIEAFDFTSKVDSLFMGEPEAIYLVSRPLAGSKITIVAEEYLSNLYHPVFIGTDANNSLEFLQNASPVVTDNMYNFVAAVASENANYQSYRDTYIARYSQEPTPFSENTYDAMYLIIYAMLAAQSDDRLEIAEHLREVASEGQIVNINDFARAKALLETGVDIDYNGASGNLKLNDNGDIASTFINVLVSNTQVFEIVEKVLYTEGG